MEQNNEYAIAMSNAGKTGHPREMAELAHIAEESGWDGYFTFKEDGDMTPEDVVSIRCAIQEIRGTIQDFELGIGGNAMKCLFYVIKLK